MCCPAMIPDRPAARTGAGDPAPQERPAGRGAGPGGLPFSRRSTDTVRHPAAPVQPVPPGPPPPARASGSAVASSPRHRGAVKNVSRPTLRFRDRVTAKAQHVLCSPALTAPPVWPAPVQSAAAPARRAHGQLRGALPCGRCRGTGCGGGVLGSSRRTRSRRFGPEGRPCREGGWRLAKSGAGNGQCPVGLPRHAPAGPGMEASECGARRARDEFRAAGGERRPTRASGLLPARRPRRAGPAQRLVRPRVRREHDAGRHCLPCPVPRSRRPLFGNRQPATAERQSASGVGVREPCARQPGSQAARQPGGRSARRSVGRGGVWWIVPGCRVAGLPGWPVLRCGCVPGCRGEGELPGGGGGLACSGRPGAGAVGCGGEVEPDLLTDRVGCLLRSWKSEFP